MSKKKRDFILFIQDIKDSIEKIKKWTDNINLHEFLKMKY